MQHAMLDVERVGAEGRDRQGIQKTSTAMQASWSFLHRGETALANMETYDLRQSIKKRFPDWPHFEVTARSSKGAMTLSARTPAAATWMAENMCQVMALIAAQAQRPLPVFPNLVTPGMSSTGRHLYYIRTLMVARARRSVPWDGWLTEELNEDKRDELAKLIADGISIELQRWSVLVHGRALSGVVVTDVGKPMPIVPSSGPRGLARVGVKFIAPWSIDGDVFAGQHTLMGYGLVRRGGEVDKTPAVVAAGLIDMAQEEII